MSKQKKIPPRTINDYDDIKPPEPKKAEEPDFDKTATFHKSRKPMLKRLLASKVAKTITGILGGVLGTGGSLVAGIDPEFAVLVGATAFIALFMGMEKAERFYAIFKDRPKKEDS